jgi:hypothetical protein
MTARSRRTPWRSAPELATALKAQAALVYVVDPTLAFQPDSGIPAAEWVATLKREGQSFLATAAQRTGEPPAWQFLREENPRTRSSQRRVNGTRT